MKEMGHSQDPSAQLPPSNLEEIKRRVARQAHGPYYGARINWAAIQLFMFLGFGVLLVACWFRLVLPEIDAQSKQVAALTAQVKDLKSQIPTAESIRSLIPPSGVTAEAVDSQIDDKLGPIRSQITEALDDATAANTAAQSAKDTAAKAFNNPPVAIYGQQAMLFVGKTLEDVRNRLSALEENAFGKSRAATVTTDPVPVPAIDTLPTASGAIPSDGAATPSAPPVSGSTSEPPR